MPSGTPNVTDHERGEAEENGPERKAQIARRSLTPRAGADARVARAAAKANLKDQKEEAKCEQNDCQERGLRAIEAGPVFRVNLGGESAETQQREGPELDQHVESDEQHPAK